MENRKGEELLKKYLNESCTPEEKALIESWYVKVSAEKFNESATEADYLAIEAELWNKLKRQSGVQKKRTLWYSAAAAAVLLIGISTFVYFSDTRKNHQVEKNYTKKEIIPGSNKAQLILADGSKIDLAEAKDGVLVKQAGVSITKMADGQLAYYIEPHAAASAVTFNTIVIPKGGQYQVNLPDDTKVWLNAASSLTFPTAFTGKERLVKLSGEAYFEVTKNSEQPFKVESSDQTVEVLGTHFNVNCYSDEPFIRTVLLEGSVKVSSSDKSAVIKPGQQTIFQRDNRELFVKKADVGEAVAWKNGYFQFNNENVESIMRKVSRWYDVDVVYQKGFVNKSFVGTISRFENVSKVLRMLELTGAVHFKVSERRILVMN